MINKRVYFTLFFILIAILTVFYSDSISLVNTLNHIRQISLKDVFIVFGLVALQFFFQSVRLFILIPGCGKRYFYYIFRLYVFGQALNHWLPARAGDIYKLAKLIKMRTDNRLTKTRALMILASDRLSHIFALLILTIGSNLKQFLELCGKTTEQTLLISVFILIATGLLAIFRKKIRLERLFHDLKHIIYSKCFIYAVAVAMFSWFCESYALIIVCKSISIELSLNQAIFVLFVLNIGIAVPISMANIGPYEAAITFALTRIGVMTGNALSVSLLHHFMQTLTLVAMALAIFPFRSGCNKVGSNCHEN